MNKQYLGDGVYCETEDLTGELVLTTSNGLEDTNSIVLEPEVWSNLLEYVDQMKRK